MKNISMLFLAGEQKIKISNTEQNFSVMTNLDYEIWIKLNSKNSDGTYSYTL